MNYSTSKDAAEKVVTEIVKNGGKALAIQANVAKQTEIEKLFADTMQAFGGLDILVNNAGVYEFAPIESITPDQFHKMFDLNVLGLLLTTQEAIKHIGLQGGSIVNVSSVVSTGPMPKSAVYSATKAAVDAVTKALAKELVPKKIRVNTVNPGMVETEGLHAAGMGEGEMRRQMESITPLGRIGQPEDIAPAVVFLASNDSSWITGESIFIAGGYR